VSESLITEQKEHEENVNDLERKAVQEKDRLKKEMALKIKVGRCRLTLSNMCWKAPGSMLLKLRCDGRLSNFQSQLAPLHQGDEFGADEADRQPAGDHHETHHHGE